MSDIKSINEPATTRQAMLTPQSINEPMAPPEIPTPQAPEPEPDIGKTEAAENLDVDYRDPDELEEEIEAAEEEGDFKSLHPKRSKTKRGR